MRESYTNPLVLIERHITSKFRTMRLVYIEPFPSYYTLYLIILCRFLFYFISLLLSNPILVFNKIDIVTRIL
jgi:hypothetical protein